MNIIENNKMIAEFLVKVDSRWSKDDNQGDGEQLYFQPHDTEFQQMYAHEMLFDKDWNWLMEVVEKIESLGYSIIINENWCVIKSKRTLYKKERIANTKIEAVYLAVVELIKSQKQTV